MKNINYTINYTMKFISKLSKMIYSLILMNSISVEFVHP